MSEADAVCILRDHAGQRYGHVTMKEAVNDNVFGIWVHYVVHNLKPGFHGFHIHQTGNEMDGCKSMGGHFNPAGRLHGGLDTRERHAGDLGNILANARGVARGSLFVKYLFIFEERFGVMGRGLVVHADRDDLGRNSLFDSESAETGNAGARVCCGVIGRF